MRFKVTLHFVVPALVFLICNSQEIHAADECGGTLEDSPAVVCSQENYNSGIAYTRNSASISVVTNSNTNIGSANVKHGLEVITKEAMDGDNINVEHKGSIQAQSIGIYSSITGVHTGEESGRITIRVDGSINTLAESDPSLKDTQFPPGVVGVYAQASPKQGAQSKVLIDIALRPKAKITARGNGVRVWNNTLGGVQINTATGSEITTLGTKIRGAIGVVVNNSDNDAAVHLNHHGNIQTGYQGMNIRSIGTGVINVNHHGAIEIDNDTQDTLDLNGISIQRLGNSQGGDIVVRSSGNILDKSAVARVNGIRAVTAGQHSSKTSNFDISVDGGRIFTPGGYAVLARNAWSGTVKVKIAQDAYLGGSRGIFAGFARELRNRAWDNKIDRNQSSIQVENAGIITSEYKSIVAWNTSTGPLRVINSGQITAGANGIEVRSPCQGASLCDQHIHIKSGGRVRTEPKSNLARYSAIHLNGGGRVVIEPNAHVGHINSEQTAIRVAEPTTPARKCGTEINCELEVFVHAAQGKTFEIDGWIRNEAGNEKTTVKAVVDNGAPLTLEVNQVKLIQSGAWDYTFVRKNYPQTQSASRAQTDTRVTGATTFAPRANLYEALPTILLGITPPFCEHPVEPESSTSVSVGIITDQGRWSAERSTTENLSYEYNYNGIESCLRVVENEANRATVGVFRVNGKVDAVNGGRLSLNATGLGIFGKTEWQNNAYAKVHAAVMRYGDIRLTSPNLLLGARPVAGTGQQLSSEIGKNFPRSDDTNLTLRAGMKWSSVDFDTIVDPHVNATVSRTAASSKKAYLGVAASRLTPATVKNGRFNQIIASAEWEHELANDTAVIVSGTELRTVPKRNRLKLALGSATFWNQGQSMLQTQIHYTTAGSGNRSFGGNLSLTFLF